MWHCNLYLCFGEGPLLHVFCLQHFISYFYLACCFQLFSSATISFLHCPSCNVGPKWESLVILARISFSSRYTGVTQSRQPSMFKQQSGVTARTNFSSRVLVLPAKERFSFKVYVFSKECLILVKGKQNNMLHFYRLHKLLFPENAWDRITLNVVYF